MPKFALIDDANRADNTDPSNGGAIPWVQNIGTAFASHDIVSNQMKAPVGAFGSDYWDVVYDNNQAISYTVVAGPGASGAFRVYLCLNGTGADTFTGYEFEFDSSNSYIVRKDSGARNTLLVTGVTITAGMKILFRRRGPVVEAFYKPDSSYNEWLSLGHIYDETFTTGGKVGIWSQNTTTLIIDDIYAGNIPFSSYGKYVRALNPSSFWDFDEGSLADFGAGGLTLVAATQSPKRAPSLIPVEKNKPAGAVRLVGGGLWLLTNAQEYGFPAPSPDWTINMWIRIESNTFASGFQRLFEKRDAGGDNEGYYFYGQSQDQTAFDVDPGTGAPEGWGHDNAMRKGKHHMLTVSYDAANKRVWTYKDGVPISSKDDFSFENDLFANTNPADPFALGVTSDGGNNFFLGVMDEVAVWEGTRLTDSQILRMYNNSEFPAVVDVATTVDNATGTSFVCNMPDSGEGDIIYALIGFETSGAATCSTPSGWTLIGDTELFSVPMEGRLYLFGKRATGAEGATETFVLNGNRYKVATIFSVAGVDPSLNNLAPDYEELTHTTSQTNQSHPGFMNSKYMETIFVAWFTNHEDALGATSMTSNNIEIADGPPAGFTEPLIAVYAAHVYAPDSYDWEVTLDNASQAVSIAWGIGLDPERSVAVFNNPPRMRS